MHSQIAFAPGESIRRRLRRIGLRREILFGLFQLAASGFQRLIRSFQRLLALLQVAQRLFQTQVVGVHQRARPVEHRSRHADARGDVEGIRAAWHAIPKPESRPQFL